MTDSNLQTWKVPFIAEIWKDAFTHAIIDKSHDITIGDFTIHLEPIDKEKISGYFLFQFNNQDNSVNAAEEFADQFKHNDFEYFRKMLCLKGLNLDVTWKKIETVNFPKGKTLSISKPFTFKYKILNEPILFNVNNIKSLEKTYKKIQNHEYKDYIDNILNLSTTKSSNEKEDFFYKWVSFNQIYSYDGEDNESEQASIKRFALTYSTFSESIQQLEKYDTFLRELYSIDHFNKNKKENFSVELKNAISETNRTNIWTYSFLCMYSIRNEFFHEGTHKSEFDKLSNFLSEIVLTALNNIFELK